jgi:hypothetical protein
MDILKNTYLVTGLYIGAAILVILSGLWREHIYREKSNKQQDELNAKQTKINDQQQEMIRLIYKISDLQAKRSNIISQDIGQVKTLIETMKKEAILSESTAKTMIESLETKIQSHSSVIDVVQPSGSVKGNK